MEHKTTRLLKSIFDSIPRRSLISEHMGVEFDVNARNLFEINGDALTFQAQLLPYQSKRSLIGETDLRVADVSNYQTPYTEIRNQLFSTPRRNP
jgi:hypothetical protein